MLKSYTYPISFQNPCLQGWKKISFQWPSFLSTGRHQSPLIKSRKMPINIPAFAYREMLAHTSGILELRILLHLCNFPSVELLTYIFVCLAELLCAHVHGKNEVDKFIRGYLMRKHSFGLLNLPIFTKLFSNSKLFSDLSNFSNVCQCIVVKHVICAGLSDQSAKFVQAET